MSFDCPKCGGASHTRSSRYISENTKERYLQCQTLGCGFSFVTVESFIRQVTAPTPLEKVKNVKSRKRA